MERLGTPVKAVTKIAGMMIMMLALFILLPSGKAYAQNYGLWVNNVQVRMKIKKMYLAMPTDL